MYYICGIKNRMANSLYLSYDGMTDPLGQSQVLPYLFGLSKLGHSITLVSFEKRENDYLSKKIFDLCKENNVHWYPLTYTKNPPVFSTIYDLLKLLRLVRKLHQQFSFDIIHCRSYLTALIGLHLKRKKGISFLFDMRGFWADERVEGNIWNLKNPIFKLVFKFFKKKEKQFFTEADHIISLTYAGKKIIQDWEIEIGKIAPITVIPCCVDLNLFDYNKYKYIKPDPHYFTLGYIGSIGTWYLLDEMLDFFKYFLENKPESIFKFITKDNPALILEKSRAKQIPLHKIQIVTSTREDIPKHIATLDASIFFIKPSFSKQASSPTKMAEIMAMGKPIICNSYVGDSDELVKQEKLGLVVKQFDKKHYQKVIQEMNNFELDILKLNAFTQLQFSLKEGVKRYYSVYEALSNKKTD